MGEKPKGQGKCAINQINPQTTPQIPTGVTSHPRHNVGSREKERRAPARQVGLFVFWPSGLLGTSWCGCRVTSDSTLLKNEKLPNEPISDFGLRSLHQELMPIHTPREPGKRTHFSRVTPEPPPRRTCLAGHRGRRKRIGNRAFSRASDVAKSELFGSFRTKGA